MTTAESDQLAAIARDAGHMAKDANGFAELEGDAYDAFNYGVHVARNVIRAGVSVEQAKQAREIQNLIFTAILATLDAFIAGTVPTEG